MRIPVIAHDFDHPLTTLTSPALNSMGNFCSEELGSFGEQRRCEALIALGKQVIVIDLNPLSRTARMAHVTIVDEVSRAMAELCRALVAEPQVSDWDNEQALRDALEIMGEASKRI